MRDRITQIKEDIERLQAELKQLQTPKGIAHISVGLCFSRPLAPKYIYLRTSGGAVQISGGIDNGKEYLSTAFDDVAWEVISVKIVRVME